MQEIKFKPKITPSQVKEELVKEELAKIDRLTKKNKGNDHSENLGPVEKTLPPAEKKAKQKKNVPKEVKKEDKETVTFPLAARINPYGFIFLKAKWLAALSWRVDMPLSIDKNPDGSVTIRKA